MKLYEMLRRDLKIDESIQYSLKDLCEIAERAYGNDKSIQISNLPKSTNLPVCSNSTSGPRQINEMRNVPTNSMATNIPVCCNSGPRQFNQISNLPTNPMATIRPVCSNSGPRQFNQISNIQTNPMATNIPVCCNSISGPRQFNEISNIQTNPMAIIRPVCSNSGPRQHNENSNIQTNSMATNILVCSNSGPRQHNENSNIRTQTKTILTKRLVCLICIGMIETYHISALTECKHRFHIFCFENWIKQNSTCPVCRKVLMGFFLIQN